MKNKKLIILISAIIIIAAIPTYIFIIQPMLADKIPDLIPRTGDSNLSSEYVNAQRSVDFYRQKIQDNPKEIKNYVELAQVFLQEARITGRHHDYIPKAESLIKTALNINPNYFDALITKASIKMTYHRFHEAKELAQKCVGIYEYNAFAYGVLVDAYVELGEYDKAVEACDKMLSIRPDLRSYSRAAYIREIHGDNDGSVKALLLAANAGVIGQENRAWVLYTLGKMMATEGKLDSAKYLFDSILEERPGYGYAYSGLAEVYLGRKNYGKSIENLVMAARYTPNHIFIEQLANVYKVMGDKENEEKMIEKVYDAFEQHQDDGWMIDGEYAIFSLNHSINKEEALAKAEKEYKRRPENIDAEHIYAWALYMNGKKDEALSIIKKAVRLETQNPLLHYHAGMIFKKAGRRDMALNHLKLALQINPYLSTMYAINIEDDISSLQNYVSVK